MTATASQFPPDPAAGAGSGWDYTASADGARSGRLVFTSGAAGLTLAVDAAEADALCRARFTGRPPSVEARGGVVRAAYRWRFDWWPFGGEGATATFALSPRLPWDVEIRGGLSTLRADLRGLDLRSFEILGGASEMELILPRPSVPGRVRIVGGASRITVLRPVGVPVRLTILGGASHLAFDGQLLESVGGQIALGGHDAAGGWEVDVLGGASDVTVATLPP